MAVPRIILASGSPRRQALIGELGLPVELRPVDVPEVPWPGEPPEQTATRLALAKAEAAASQGGTAVVVAGDTVVVDRGTILGKPGDPAEARAMLRRLRGRWHEVITGLALIDLPTGRRDVSAVTTRVRMRDYSDEEIERYVRSGSPLDKAGAYGIQDAAFHPVERIAGCYLNVVGLPLCAVVGALRRLGYSLPESPYSSGECRCADSTSGQESSSRRSAPRAAG